MKILRILQIQAFLFTTLFVEHFFELFLLNIL